MELVVEPNNMRRVYKCVLKSLVAASVDRPTAEELKALAGDAVVKCKGGTVGGAVPATGGAPTTHSQG